LITEIFLEKLPTYLLESTASEKHGLACLDETKKLRKLHSISKTVSRHSKWKKIGFQDEKRDISASELKWIGLWRSKNISLTQAFFTYQRVLKNYNRFPSFSCKYLKKG
jgi:hypothetical protein